MMLTKPRWRTTRAPASGRSADEILNRFLRYCAELKIAPLGLSPKRHQEGLRHWIYPVMDKVIAGIKTRDMACIRTGIEFIHEDGSFPFGRIPEAHTARVLSTPG